MKMKVCNKGTKSTTDISQYNCTIYGKLDKEINTKFSIINAVRNLGDKTLAARVYLRTD